MSDNAAANKRLIASAAVLFGAAALGALVGARVAGPDDVPPPAASSTPGVPAGVKGVAALPNVPATPGAVSLADMVEAVLPAVVQVQVRERVTDDEMDGDEMEGPFGDMMRRFFNDRGIRPENRVQEMLGSGFVIDQKGYIVTNNHVVDGASDVQVRFPDGRQLVAKLVGADKRTDLAVLKLVKAGSYQSVTWGDSAHLRPGDPVFAVGSPYGLGGTVTSGIISGRGREIGQGPYDDFLQVDAPINRGNSGGPLFDRAGHVVGINTAIFSPSGGSVGIGFSIPSEMAQTVIKQLIAEGRVTRGQIGVTVQDVTPDIADSLGLDRPGGALIGGVAPGTAAAKSGLKRGDVVVSFDGRAVESSRDLSRAVAGTPVGKAVQMKVLRDGEDMQIGITVGQMRPEGRVAKAEAPQRATPPETGSALGMRLAATNPRLNAQAGLPANAQGALVVDLAPDSDAADRGLEPGDLITSANGVAVAGSKDLEKVMKLARGNGRRNILLEVQRGNQRFFVPLPLG